MLFRSGHSYYRWTQTNGGSGLGNTSSVLTPGRHTMLFSISPTGAFVERTDGVAVTGSLTMVSGMKLLRIDLGSPTGIAVPLAAVAYRGPLSTPDLLAVERWLRAHT